MIRQSFMTAAITAAIALPASAVTISVLPLDENNLLQNPDNLVLDYLRGGETIGARTERDVKDNRDNAQSFLLTTATTIDAIAIQYSDLRTNGATMTFEFFRVADADATSLIVDGDIIDSFTFDGSHPAFNGNLAGTLIFDVTDTVAAAGDAFAIRFDTDPGTTHSFKWEILHDKRNDVGFTGGQAYEKNTGGGSNFHKVYTIGVVAVPEPASLSLLGISGLALLRRRRLMLC